MAHIRVPKGGPTRRHVKSRATTKIIRDGILGGQAKVGQLDGSIQGHEDILGLQVTMVDSQLMAISDGFADLHKSVLDQGIVILVQTFFGNVGEEIASGAELQDDEDGVVGFHDAVEGDDIGVMGDGQMQFDLSPLELVLTWIPCLGQRFDGQRGVGADIHGGVDGSIRSQASDFQELQPVAEDPAYSIFWTHHFIWQ